MNVLKEVFEKRGFVSIDGLIPNDELPKLQLIYDDFLSGKFDLTGLRGDLSGDDSKQRKVEKITQIMRPSLVMPLLQQTETYRRVVALAKEWLGADMEIDFDMMIDKAPGTAAETPWHQDAAYWPEMPDTRALSFWIALDDADRANGCMMYVAGSHKEPLRAHTQPVPNAALQCTLTAADDVTHGEITAGSAIAHHGYTLHGALGNHSSNRHRRALIVNLRPESMIHFIRSKGYDHLGKRAIKHNEESLENKD